MDFLNLIKADKIKTQVQQIDQHTVIQKAVEIDYNMVKKSLKIASTLSKGSTFSKGLDRILPYTVILSDAANNYKCSESDDKDAEYIDYLKANVDLETLTPIANRIPGGNTILKLLQILLVEEK